MTVEVAKGEYKLVTLTLNVGFGREIYILISYI